jgi:tetratricopeptide (TPR) repeat protein
MVQRQMGRFAGKSMARNGRGGVSRETIAALVFCFLLCFLPLVFGEARLSDDYEFQKIREAYEAREAVLGLSPAIRNFWEGKEGRGEGGSGEVERVLLAKKGNLDNNPFYHMLLGEIYFRRQDTERAQEEWTGAVALAGDDLFVRWYLLREHCLRGHHEEAERELPQIMGHYEQASTERLPELSYQAVRSAQEVRERRDLALALGLVNLALHLDPRSAEAHYLRASILWRMSKYNLSKVLDDMLQGTLGGFKEEKNLYGLSLNLLSASVSAYFFFFLLMGTVLFYKYEPLLRHEFQERTGADARSPFGFFLLGFLYFIPLFCLLGWGWLLLFWVILIFPYSILKERIILSLLVLVLFSLPFFYRFSASFLIAQNDPLIQSTTEVEEGRASKKVNDFFTQEAKEHPGDPTPPFYLGLLHKARGELAQAEREFQVSIERLPNLAAAHNNLGNIYFLQERYEEAEDQYRKAIALDPSAAPTHMNLSLLLTFFPQRLRIEEAKVESDLAEKLQLGITQRIESYDDPQIEKQLLYQGLPKKDLWKRVWLASSDRDLLADSLWGERIRFLPLRALPFFPIPFLFLLWLSARARARGPHPRFCQECGKVICNVCQKALPPEPSCASCYSVFHLREASIPQFRIERLILRDRYGEMEKRKVRVLSFLPGAASLYLGKSWLGLILAAPFLFLLIYWIGWSEIVLVPGISPIRRSLPFLWGGSFLILLLIIYRISLLRGFRWSA